MKILQKFVIATSLALIPSLFVIVTTPLNALHEHITHILLLLILGVGTAGYYLYGELNKSLSIKKIIKTSPAAIFAFIALTFFLNTYALPCPYMLSSDSAATMISHPCSQPIMPSVETVSFSPGKEYLISLIISAPILPLSAQIVVLDNKSPPLI